MTIQGSGQISSPWDNPTFGTHPLVVRLGESTYRSKNMYPWKNTGKEAEPDSKHRISLGTTIKTEPGVRYRVMVNELGQILLDPVKSVPAREAWIYENEERIASIKRGIAQAEAGQVVNIDLGPDEPDFDEED